MADDRGYYIEHMRLDEYISRFSPLNPKDHNLGAIDVSYDTFGFTEPPLIDETSGKVVAGHGRGKQLMQRMQKNDSPPDGIQVADDGMWQLPVVRGVKFKDDDHVKAYLVASNNLTMQGGWNDEELASLLQGLALEDENLLNATGFDADDLDMLLILNKIEPALHNY